MQLLADEKTNAKLAKSSGSEYYTVGLSLAPAGLKPKGPLARKGANNSDNPFVA